MTVEIRHVRPGDEALFERVAEDVFDGPIVPARVRAYLEDRSHIMLLALDGGEVVGQVAAIVHRHPDLPTELYIDNLGVAPARQREGIGRRLVAEALRIGEALGCEEAWVGTEHDNIPARRLYETFGAKADPFVLYFLDW